MTQGNVFVEVPVTERKEFFAYFVDQNVKSQP